MSEKVLEALDKLKQVETSIPEENQEPEEKVIAEDNDEKHIRRFKETEDSYIIEFGKSGMEENDEPEEEQEEEFKADSLYIKSDIKAETDDEGEFGVFEGYGSIFGNTDLGNDVIVKGAFTKSLKEFRAPHEVKLLYQHKSDMPIGKFDEIYEDARGLVVKGRLALKTQAGREAYELLKMGALDGLSIGFKINPKQVSYEKQSNRRIIKEVQLMEVSLVTFPMNPKATIRSVKGQEITVREWEKGLRDAFQLSRSEAKIAAVAVSKCFDQRDAGSDTEVVEAIKTLTNKLLTN